VATTTGRSSRRTSYRDVLAYGEFRVVLSAWVISMLGNVVSHVALAVLVLDRTGSPLLSALTFALGFVPYAVGGALFSAVSDRYPVRRVLVAGDLVQAALVAAMVVPGVPVWALLGLVAATGVVAPVYSGARSAALPDMMSAEAFPLARALLRMVAMGSQIVGFAVGGALLVFLEPRGLLVLDAASFALSAALLRFGTLARPAPGARSGADAGRRSITRDSWTGVRLALASRRVRPLLLLTWLPPMFAVVPEGLAAPYVERLDAPDSGLGVLLGATAVGSVVGAVALGSWASAATRERLVVPLALVQLAPLLAFVLHPSLLAAGSLLVLVGLGTTYELGLDQRLLAALDDGNRGVVLSISSSGLMLSQGLGFALAGAAAELLPLTAVIAGSGALGLVVVALLVRSSATAAAPATGRRMSR
jgi:MFS family permease